MEYDLMFFISVSINIIILIFTIYLFKHDYIPVKKENYELESRTRKQQQQINNLHSTITTKEKELTATQQKVLKLKNKIDENATFEYDDVLDSFSIEISYLKKEINDLQHKISWLKSFNIDGANEIIKAKQECINLSKEIKDLRDQNRFLYNKVSFFESTKSNLTAIPYMAQIMADYETYGLDILTRQLNWGNSVERKKKVESITSLRKQTKQLLEKYKESEYQLAYLLELYPALQDVIDCEFKQLPLTDFENISDYDKTRDYLSKEEYESLSVTERNQLALDRYKSSTNKSKWQIGRDYELYVGYRYTKKGYTVDYFGSYMGLEDLGRDLIAKKDGTTLIIQCKYWSSNKLIHEKHITQLYGTMVCYCIEHNLIPQFVKCVLVTNIRLSDMAKRMADYLDVQYVENFDKGDYPCIKCNIGHDEYGNTYIYHLPFDQQYDATKIDKPGEFFAMTVKEAEEKGFRRAFKWFGNN